jgi:UDPglucose--hexose-1-phosphate uridylyltransferase
MNILNQLISYGIDNKIITNPSESIFKLSTLFHVEPFNFHVEPYVIDNLLESLLDYGYKHHLFSPDTIMERDCFEALIFDQIMPTPEETKQKFKKLFNQDPDLAVHYLYTLSKNVNYIKTKRLNQNIEWVYDSVYGPLQMTINLSKPEKDPKDIAKALSKPKDLEVKQGPKCVLCKENEHRYENARMNLRIVPMTLGNELWHFQYSPYGYYNEHSIILSDEHRNMKLSHQTFDYLLDFLELMPEYFIGSNADIPIVGGSILNHDHFQAGRHTFPIQDAKIIKNYGMHNQVEIKHLDWPLSTIRLKSKNRIELTRLACEFFDAWKEYTNLELDIIAQTDQIHQTITPIARIHQGFYELDIVLRNNRTSKQYPDGIFHPHQDVQHIKKENIGLIEAMGLAILPGRLKDELELSLEYIQNGKEDQSLEQHKPWLDELKKKMTINTVNDLYIEVGKVFSRVLEDSGVFKLDDKGMNAIDHFILEVLHQK